MAYPSSGGMDPLVLGAECRFTSPRTRIQLPPLLPSNDCTAAKQPNRRAGAYPRRRAVRACQVCRARRTKCDNKKPSCSFCEKIGAKCVVNDPADLSGFDTASLVIIQRLDQIESLIQKQQQQQQSQQIQHGRTVVDHSDGMQAERRVSAVADSESPTLHGSPLYQAHGADLSRLTIETVLSWSVFNGRYDAGPSLNDLVLSQTTLSQEPFLANNDPRLERLDLDLKTCTRLLHTFLEEVHIANPILDVPLVTDYLYQACVHGIGWDAPSCLVLLICAIGAISESFQEHHEASSMTSRRSPSFHLGRRYFEAAQMRLGVVFRTNGVLETQCFFYSGVYLMAVFQPIRAWRCFVQTAAMAETIVFSSNGSDTTASLKRDLRCLETTHWACLKSELELRLELGLNQPDPLRFTYPTFFPSLPMERLNREESRVWYFYLAETAIRRLAMRVIQLCFWHQTHGRFPDAHNMREASLDFEIQASEWTSSLPQVLSLSTPEMDDDVLKFVLRGHLLDCYEWIYFPYMLEAIAHGNRDPETDEFVVRGLQMSVERIHKNRKGYRHRHHGVWLMLRSCTRSALILLAASRSSATHELLPLGWKGAVMSAADMLAYWKDEAEDARDRLRILHELMEEWTNEGQQELGNFGVGCGG
ncbi:transcription factor domain-containing protein [Aspergillus foveolatus]|uniref:transcription factor domain-containing protein n=1 Tax=Aspergillus foveolatus TaxID=210207 RepID=UPI003CCD6FE8